MRTPPIPSPVEPPTSKSSSQRHHRRHSSRSNYFTSPVPQPDHSVITTTIEQEQEQQQQEQEQDSTTPKPVQSNDNVAPGVAGNPQTNPSFVDPDSFEKPTCPYQTQAQSMHTLDELRRKMGEAIMHQQTQYNSHGSLSTDSGFADLDTTTTPDHRDEHQCQSNASSEKKIPIISPHKEKKPAVTRDPGHSTLTSYPSLPAVSQCPVSEQPSHGGSGYYHNKSHASHSPRTRSTKRSTRHPITAGALKGINGPHVSIPDFTPSNPTAAVAEQYPTPNLYDITLALNADPGVDGWWSNVVPIFKEHYGAERASLAIPGDVTDLENVPWGQKATYSVYGNESASPSTKLGNEPEPSSKSRRVDETIGPVKANADGNTLKYTKSVSGTRRPKLSGRHSFAGYGATIPKDIPHNGNSTGTNFLRNRRKSSSSGEPRKQLKHLRDEETQTEDVDDSLPFHRQQQQQPQRHQTRLSCETDGSQSPSTVVFPVPRALEVEPDALIKRTGVVRLFGRTKPVVLTRQYAHDPMEPSSIGNAPFHNHKDIIQTTPQVENSRGHLMPVAKAPRVGLTNNTTMTAPPPYEKTGTLKNTSMANNNNYIPFDPSPPTKQYEEYEQTPPSPWSQSPAPSPAPLSKPDTNPFFTTPEVDEDAFASSPPTHDYSVSTPLQAIGVDHHAKTVIHIPLIHSPLSRQTTSETLRFPVAIISLVTPINPYPSNLRNSLAHLLPHLTTSFCLAQQYSQLEKQLSSSSTERYGHLLGLGGTFSDANSELELVAGLSGHVSYSIGKDRPRTTLPSPIMASSTGMSYNAPPDFEPLSSLSRNEVFQSPSPMPRSGFESSEGYFRTKNRILDAIQPSAKSPKSTEGFQVPLTPIMRQKESYDELTSRDPGLVPTPSTIDISKRVSTPIPLSATSRHSSSASLATQIHRDLSPRPFPDTIAQLMLNSVPLHLFLAKPLTGEVIWTNAKFDAYRRSQPHEPRVRDPWQNVHGSEYENLVKEWSKALHTGSQFTERVRVKRFNDDSAYRWFIFRANPLISATGELLYWIGSFLDVHEQHVSEMKAAQERAMFATDAKYRALANSIPQVVFEAAEYRGLISANEQWELYTGQPLEEAKNLGFAKYIHRDDLEKCGILSPPQVIPESNDVPEFTKIILNPGDPQSPDDSNTSTPKNSSTPSTHGNTDGNENGNPPKAERFPSFSRGLTAELQRLVRKKVVSIQRDENGRDSYTTEIRFRSRKADFRWHLVRLVKVETTSFGNGEASWYGTCTDINDRKLLERELNTAMQKLNKEMESKTKFFSNMSHEIRTPLNGILGTIPFILDTHLDNDQRRMLDTIQNSSTNLRELVDNILDVSKVEAGKMNIVWQWFHLRSVIEDAIDTIGSRAIDKGLELNYIVDIDVPSMVMGDRFRIRQILINLMGNAVKFTPRGEVCTRCSIYTDRSSKLNSSDVLVNFEVVDTGKGFSATDAARLMQRFSQIESNGSQQHAGSGLGLFLSKQLVEMHGGRLTPSSKEGQGAKFSFFVRFGAFPQPPSYLPIGNMWMDSKQQQDLSETRSSSSSDLLSKDRPTDSLTTTSSSASFSTSATSPQADGGLKPTEEAYSALIICPFDYAREAIKQHIEQVIPYRTPATITSILDVDDWQNLAATKSSSPLTTHLVLGLPDVNEIMEVMHTLLRPGRKHTPTLVIIADIYMKREVYSLYREMLAADKKVYIVPKPVKPSAFSPIFDSGSERELSKDRNQDMAREVNNTFKNMAKLVKEVIGNKGFRILLVEDDETNRIVMLKYLEKVKLVSETAGNGQECVDMVFSKEPGYYSLIICDIQMPIKNGYETCQEIRSWEQRNHFPEIPIMALSANAMMDQIDDAAQAGFNDYVTKPIKHNELGKMMMDLLDPTTPQVLLKDRKS